MSAGAGASAGTEVNSPMELADRVVRLLDDGAASRSVSDGGPTGGSVSDGGAHGRATVDLPAERWPAAVRVARDELGCDFFDWLSAVDQGADGFDVICHLWSTTGRFGLLLRTRVPRDAPALPSIVELYPGAAWPEREAHEMFGLDFPGHPDLAPLLLAPQFEGHPLRKDFVLSSRVVRPWPGAPAGVAQRSPQSSAPGFQPASPGAPAGGAQRSTQSSAPGLQPASPGGVDAAAGGRARAALRPLGVPPDVVLASPEQPSTSDQS